MINTHLTKPSNLESHNLLTQQRPTSNSTIGQTEIQQTQHICSTFDHSSFTCTDIFLPYYSIQPWSSCLERSIYFYKGYTKIEYPLPPPPPSRTILFIHIASINPKITISSQWQHQHRRSATINLGIAVMVILYDDEGNDFSSWRLSHYSLADYEN